MVTVNCSGCLSQSWVAGYNVIPGLGRLHVQCNRLRLPLGSVITIMITQFSKVIEYDYDYMTKVIDYYSTIMITMKLVCV